MQKPKQWGRGTRPEGMGKLRTAEDTMPVPYLTVSGPGFIATKNGAFHQVTAIDPPPEPANPQQLFFTGFDAPDGEYRRRGAPLSDAFRLGGFTPAVGVVLLPTSATWMCGVSVESDTTQTMTVSYTDHLGDARTAVCEWRDMTNTGLFTRRFGGGSTVAIDFLGEVKRVLPSPALLSGVAMAPLGYVDGGSPETGVAFLYPYRNGGATAYGVPTVGVRITLAVATDKVVDTYSGELPEPPSMGYGATDLVCAAVASTAPGRMIALIVEFPPDIRDIDAGPYTDTAVDGATIEFDNSSLRLWTYHTSNYGGAWDVHRMEGLDVSTTAISPEDPDGTLGPEPFLGHRSYLTVVKPTTGETVLYQGGPQVTGAVGTQQRAVGEGLTATELLAVSQDVILMFGYIPDGRRYPGSSDPVAFRSFVLRSADGGVTWASISTPVSAAVEDTPLDDERDTPPDFEACSVGDGVIVCRIAMGLRRSEDRALRFIRSFDYGASWEEFFPAGLPATSSKQLGTFFTLPALRDEVRLAVTAWDGVAYRVYTSDDLGDTFEHRTKVLKPFAFAQMDAGRIAEPGVPRGNFGVATYIPIKPYQPIDPGAPWRVDSRYPPP